MESCFIVALFCSSFYLLDLCGQLYCLVLLPHQLAMQSEDVCLSLWSVTFRLQGCSDENRDPLILSASCKLKQKGLRNLCRTFSVFSCRLPASPSEPKKRKSRARQSSANCRRLPPQSPSRLAAAQQLHQRRWSQCSLPTHSPKRNP